MIFLIVLTSCEQTKKENLVSWKIENKQIKSDDNQYKPVNIDKSKESEISDCYLNLWKKSIDKLNTTLNQDYEA